VRKNKRTKKPVAVKKLPGYIILLCGHYTTVEEQRVFFSAAGKRFPRSYTQRTKFWCEKHAKWSVLYTHRETRPEEEAAQLPF